MPRLSWTALIAGLLTLLLPHVAKGAPSASTCVTKADLDGVINAGTVDYVLGAIEAAEQNCDALLLEVDTPGGQLEATRRLTQALLTADVPVVTYVHPSGAHASSAGLFIVLAGHVAAMAPGTNMGAAHPVTAEGRDPEEAGGEVMAEKIENDTAAFARAVAEQRGRNVDWAEKAVRSSVSITAEKAVDVGVVDLTAVDRGALLAALEGREVKVADQVQTLSSLRGANIEPHAMTWEQRSRSVLGRPGISYLLLMLGLLGLFIELSQPGLIAPGLVGATALILAAIGLGQLPLELGGLLLVIGGLVLLVAEVFVTSFGLLGLAGTLALGFGSSLLFDFSDPAFFADPRIDVHWTVIAPLSGLIGLAAVGFGWRAAQLKDQQLQTGVEELLGQSAVVLDDIDPDDPGHVRVAGERWRATAREESLSAGTEVVITNIEGLRLTVRAAAPSGESA